MRTPELTRRPSLLSWHRPTLDDFFEGFMLSLSDRDRSRSTLSNHRYLYTQVIRPVIGHLKIEDLYLGVGDQVAAAGTKIAETNGFRAVVTLRQLLKYITRQGHQLPFDWRDIEIPKYRVRKRVEAYSRKEMEQIRAFLSKPRITESKHTSEKARWQHEFALARMRAVFELNVHSGLRLAECPPINKSDIDWQRRQIQMRNAKTKELEIVYFNGAEDALRTYLAMRKDNDEALFVTHDGRRITRDGLKTHFRIVKGLIRKRVVGFRKTYASHTLRKTYGTQLVVQGKPDIKTAQRLMRHKSIRTTLNFYVALDQELAARIHRRIFTSF